MWGLLKILSPFPLPLPPSKQQNTKSKGNNFCSCARRSVSYVRVRCAVSVKAARLRSSRHAGALLEETLFSAPGSGSGGVCLRESACGFSCVPVLCSHPSPAASRSPAAWDLRKRGRPIPPALTCFLRIVLAVTASLPFRVNSGVVRQLTEVLAGLENVALSFLGDGKPLLLESAVCGQAHSPFS